MYEYNCDDLHEFLLKMSAETREKGKEITFKYCPYCNGGKNGRDMWTFSINAETGRFNCMRGSCGAKGAFVTLARDFNFELKDQDKTEYRDFDNSFVSNIASWQATEESKQALSLRGIPYEITEKYRVTTYAGNDNVLVFPFFDYNKKLKTVKYRNSKFKKGVTNGSKEWFEKDTRHILYGEWLCDDGGVLVVTEGQIDALSLAAAGIKNAVSVPGGINNWKWVENSRGFVEKFDEIVIFGDCEKGHVTLVDDFCKRFPKMKIRVVQIVDYMKCKDANEILQAFIDEDGDCEEAYKILQQAVERAKDARKSPVKQMADVEWYYSDDDKIIKTGFEQLDNAIRGLSYGQLVVLTGYSGDGKSNFASQLLVNVASQGEKCLIYSGELSNKIVKEQISFIAAGPGRICETINADGMECRKFRDEEDTKKALTEWMTDRIYIWEDTPITPDSTDENETEQFMQSLEQAIEMLGIKFIIIDNLMTLLTVSEENGDVYLAQTNIAKRLKTIAQRTDSVIMIVAHPRKSPNASRELTQDSISGSKDVVNLADMVLVYTRHNDAEKSAYARRLNILKNRRRGILLEDTAGIYLCYDSRSNRICENRTAAEHDYLVGFAKPVPKQPEFIPNIQPEDVMDFSDISF